MEPKKTDPKGRSLLVTIFYSILGAALGVGTALICFSQIWQQPYSELLPIHIFILVVSGFLCGTFAAIDGGKFLVEFFLALCQSL